MPPCPRQAANAGRVGILQLSGRSCWFVVTAYEPLENNSVMTHLPGGSVPGGAQGLNLREDYRTNFLTSISGLND
jgi:hypothetical protein